MTQTKKVAVFEIEKEPLLSIEPEMEEELYLTCIECLGELLRETYYKKGSILVQGIDMGWRKERGQFVYSFPSSYSDIQIARDFIYHVFPKANEWTANIYRRKRGKKLAIFVTHHDNPVNGDSFYLF